MVWGNFVGLSSQQHSRELLNYTCFVRSVPDVFATRTNEHHPATQGCSTPPSIFVGWASKQENSVLKYVQEIAKPSPKARWMCTSTLTPPG